MYHIKKSYPIPFDKYRDVHECFNIGLKPDLTNMSTTDNSGFDYMPKRDMNRVSNRDRTDGTDLGDKGGSRNILNKPGAKTSRNSNAGRFQ